jgi:hypothetical protein
MVCLKLNFLNLYQGIFAIGSKDPYHDIIFINDTIGNETYHFMMTVRWFYKEKEHNS